MNRKLRRILSAAKLAGATQRYQPNKELTIAYLVSADELPGTGWTMSVQQDFPKHAFSRGAGEIERARSMKSTTSRRLFNDASESRSIFIEITPFASETDAESWVASADERVKRKMSKLSDLDDFQFIGDITVPQVEHSRGVKYSMASKRSQNFTCSGGSCSRRIHPCNVLCP